jgi:hypothetical protein
MAGKDVKQLLVAVGGHWTRRGGTTNLDELLNIGDRNDPLYIPVL